MPQLIDQIPEDELEERIAAQFVDTRVYRYDFFSGANVGIWMGDVLVAEAIGIEFSLVQTKRPIFGWASTLFDAVAGGVVHVAGSLYLNFRQAHLFTSLIDRSTGAVNKSSQKWFPISDYKEQNFSTLVTGLNGEEIKNFEESVWGRELKNSQPTAAEITSNMQSARRPDAHGSSFDILVTYGDFMNAQPAANSTMRRLYNVHVTGFGQTIEIDGKPVLEAYNFLCRQVL